MASYSAKGIFGRKGAGKTHELIRIALQKLLEGRRVCIVVPQLNVDKVIRHFNDLTIADRLTVATYEDVVKPGFWPDEHFQTRLNTWRRFDMDYRTDLPTPETPRNPIPAEAFRWNSSVVIPGDIVILDEAWRWLGTSGNCPPGLRSALSMCRHWRGPADWRNSEDIQRFLSPDWFPGLGGPEYDKNGDYLGGDGTKMVTTNIIVASQRYQGLKKEYRELLEESTLLIHVDTSALPESYRERFEDGREMYAAYTFESEHVPTWAQLDRAAEKKEPIWVGEQFIYHEDYIHDFYSYADGYAREERVDDKNNIANHPNIIKLRKMLNLLKIFGIIAIIIAIFSVYFLFIRDDGSSFLGSPHVSQNSNNSLKAISNDKKVDIESSQISSLAGYSRFDGRNNGPFDNASRSDGFRGRSANSEGGSSAGKSPEFPNPFGTTRHVPNTGASVVR